ncbi:hypothetical protein C0995_002020 [Termitomyces sp. Mi166|nr:hypothetical protein C0995_002020 [Termitomyces sp. Mi166\
MKSTSVFPRELINAVIDEITDNQPALHACALVSPHFREISQRHIFHEITISFDTTQDSVRAGLLSKILLDNLSLGSFVQSLILHLGDPQLVLGHMTLLDKFPNVKEVKFTSMTTYVDWLSTPEEIQGTLTSMLRQPSLKFLALQRQNNFPIDFLLRFPNIVKLFIEASSIERSLGFAHAPPIHSPHLQSFAAVIYGDNEISLGAVKNTLNVFGQSLTDVILDDLGYEHYPPPGKPISQKAFG